MSIRRCWRPMRAWVRWCSGAASQLVGASQGGRQRQRQRERGWRSGGLARTFKMTEMRAGGPQSVDSRGGSSAARPHFKRLANNGRREGHVRCRVRRHWGLHGRGAWYVGADEGEKQAPCRRADVQTGSQRATLRAAAANQHGARTAGSLLPPKHIPAGRPSSLLSRLYLVVY
ncbi:hypothetical protein T440DRAFT_32840 [Plenodomus tracheiphilus IPT5]|uniref:Uncharacterized protein n=1 Tax=Plenodomus tracheiphilus IPT5 TaxID=1408161 RepID=A0A6A7BD46_9PLEO|nr:hypothetical protein T440DRAFT_32840 [Plenodomus tracheiphilus IPT5]